MADPELLEITTDDAIFIPIQFALGFMFLLSAIDMYPFYMWYFGWLMATLLIGITITRIMLTVASMHHKNI